MMGEGIGLLLILGAPLAAGLILIMLRGRAVRAAGPIAALGIFISLVTVLAEVPILRQHRTPSLGLEWVPAAGLWLGLRLDWIGLPFLVTAAAVTLVAVVYAWGYHHADQRTPYFYALLMLFAMGMLGTALADDMLLFYTCWELMLVASCILIAVWGEGERRGAIAMKYFIFTHAGSLLVLIALLTLYNRAGGDSLAALRAGLSLPPRALVVVVTLFLVGFGVKMAVFPLHLWLPDAHTVAPMPVTIMLAAAMLSMGTYGMLRFPFDLATPLQLQPFVLPLMIAGVVSEIYGALMALAEQDVKRVIAYSSVSQMGYVLFGLGTLTPEGVSGATIHILYHAIVKALLFMCIGLVIRATGQRRLAHLGGLGRLMPVAAVCTGIGVLAISGAPPLGILNSEWMIFSGGFHTPYLALSVVAVFGSMFTVAYALWFAGRVFFGTHPSELTLRRVPLAMTIPTVLLALLAPIAGLFPGPFFDWAAHEVSLVLGGGG